MTTDRFFRLVQVLANSLWVRCHLMSFPGYLVIEIANLNKDNLDNLRAELTNEGFCELPAEPVNEVAVIRFAVVRADGGYTASARPQFPGSTE